MMAPLGLKKIVSTMLEVGHYKWYHSPFPTLVWEFVWSCKGYLSVWPCNPLDYKEDIVTTWGSDCDISLQIKEKVPVAI